MIIWRAGPPEYFQSFLEYCYKSLDVWGVEYCIILHENSALKDEGDGIFYSYCVFENFTWWSGFDDAQIENLVRPQMHLTLKHIIKLYTFLDVGEKKKHGSSEHYLFSVALGFVWCSCSNLSIICCHFAITKWQPNCMFQLSWPVHVQRVSEYFYYLLFFVAWFVIILFV